MDAVVGPVALEPTTRGLREGQGRLSSGNQSRPGESALSRSAPE